MLSRVPFLTRRSSEVALHCGGCGHKCHRPHLHATVDVVKASGDLSTHRRQGSDVFLLRTGSKLEFYSLRIRAFNECVWPSLTSRTEMNRADSKKKEGAGRTETEKYSSERLRTWQALTREEFSGESALVSVKNPPWPETLLHHVKSSEFTHSRHCKKSVHIPKTGPVPWLCSAFDTVK